MKLPVAWKERERRELQYEGKGIGIFVEWSSGNWIFWSGTRLRELVNHEYLVRHPGFFLDMGEYGFRFSFLKWEWKARPAKVAKERIRRIEAKLKHT